MGQRRVGWVSTKPAEENELVERFEAFEEKFVVTLLEFILAKDAMDGSFEPLWRARKDLQVVAIHRETSGPHEATAVGPT